MGLDMYLSKKTYVKQWAHQDKKEQFSVSVKKGNKKYTGIKPERVSYITEEIAYWRKANQIHGWFARNGHEVTADVRYNLEGEQIQQLVNDCKKVLEILNNAPQKKAEIVAGWKNGEQYTEEIDVADLSPEDEETIMELLPPTEGFFFGSSEIDSWYKQQLEETIKVLQEEIEFNEDKYPEYQYYASW